MKKRIIDISNYNKAWAELKELLDELANPYEDDEGHSHSRNEGYIEIEFIDK